MADKKISQLTGATTPLAGTEVLPIVQSASTVKVSIDNVTKGRTVNALSFDTDVAAAGVTLSGTTLSADGTDTNIDINVTPKGTGSVNMTKVNIDGGSIDGTTIGGASAAAATVTALTASGNVSFDGGSFVFNESGADKDFRVEGDTDANLLFTDASADAIGVGTNAPTAGYKLDVHGRGRYAPTATNYICDFISPDSNGTFIQLYADDASASIVVNGTAAKPLSFFVGGGERINIGTTGDVNVKTGNLVVGTAAKGIDFSANTHAAGMTSELLDWYEEGTWTPSVTSSGGTITTVGAVSGSYTRIGRVVHLFFNVEITTNGTGSGSILIANRPFTFAANTSMGVFREQNLNGKMGSVNIPNANEIQLQFYDNSYPGADGCKFVGQITYYV